MYIADYNNCRIRKVTVSTGIITTIAGLGYGDSGDGGPATSAYFNLPNGVAVDSSGIPNYLLTVIFIYLRYSFC